MDTLHYTADADGLTRRAAALLAAGRAGGARPLLAAARRLGPPSPEALGLAGRLALQLDPPDVARAELDAALASAPDHAGLRKCRAELRRNQGDIEGATRDAAEAVILDRHDPTAKALLGVLMLDLGRPADAAACLREAVAAEPANPSFREGLAAALEAEGDSGAAMTTLLAGIELAPGMVATRNAAILLCVRHRDFNRAISLAEGARVSGVADACTFGLRGHALSSLGRHTDAADAYAEALKLGPDDPYVRHLVAAAGTMPGARRAPVEYLRAVFDGYADRFEQHLIALRYRMPGLFRAVVASHPVVAAGEQLGPVLDLGCGTGLVAVALAGLPVGPLVGVDIAPRMLRAAAAKQLYAELREADVMAVLAQDYEQWKLILAADVLCYFGALEDVFAGMHARLVPGGWLVASTEELLPDADGVVPGDGDWALQRQGRYAHTFDYVRRTALDAGFTLRRLDREAVRHEASAPVAGLLLVLERGP